MAKKPESFIPPNPKSFRPPLETKRAQLTNAREEFRQKGYAAEINIEVLKVQMTEDGDNEQIERDIKANENTRDNSYRAARKADEMLQALPALKAKP